MQKVLSLLLLTSFIAVPICELPSSATDVPVPLQRAYSSLTKNENPPPVMMVALSAKVREQPSTDARIIDLLKMGTKVKIVGQNNEWFKVEYGRSKSGWVYMNALGFRSQ